MKPYYEDGSVTIYNGDCRDVLPTRYLMNTMRLLDLFCCAGGAGMGYHRAGFDEVVGVDIKPRPHYPFEFHQGDALEFVAKHGHEFDAIHASPPCQAFSQAVTIANRKKRTNLIPATREALIATGKPYIIENVPTARKELRDTVQLCGSFFGLPIRRHRLFESTVPLWSTPCSHREYPAIYEPAWNRVNKLRVLSISGGYQQRQTDIEEHKAAMGVDWEITIPELSEAIPPAYTEWIGRQLLNSARRAQ